MKFVAVALIALLAISSGFFLFNSMKKAKTQPISVVQKYNEWKLKFGKLYATPSENDFRMEVFANSFKEIEGFNAEYEEQIALRGLPKLSGKMFDLQKHSDLTKGEFEATMIGLKLPADLNLEDYVAQEKAVAPKLGQTGFQTRIRNQGSCGSCWSFSTVAVTEKFYYDQNKIQVDFSTQDLVNCVTGCNGCGGGWPTTAMKHIGTVGLAQAYYLPYVGAQGVCATDASKRLHMGAKWAAKQVNWTPTVTTNAAAAGVWGGIAVYASAKFGSLSKTDDVYDAALSGECSYGINHAVTAIGSPSSGVVTIMNSWGTTWGFNGSKKVKACSSSLILGSPSPFMHPYSTFN